MSTQAPPEPPDPKTTRVGLQDRRILLVEDNKVNQMIVLAMLRPLGLVVEKVDHGRLALDRLAEARFDLVIMDVQMPVMDGHETTRRLRALEREHGWRRTPVLAMTANAMHEDREACLAAGMDDFVPKPFKRDVLEDMIVRWLAHGPAEAADRGEGGAGSTR